MKFNCCVPGCKNSHQNKSPDLKFYCLPKDQELRKTYDVLLKNDSLKIDSRNTRICSEHWKGGEKLSRTHQSINIPVYKEVHILSKQLFVVTIWFPVERQMMKTKMWRHCTRKCFILWLERKLLYGKLVIIGCLNKFSNCLFKKILLFFCLFFRDYKTIRILVLNFYRQSIEISSYSNC